MKAEFTRGSVRRSDDQGKKHDEPVEVVTLTGGFLGKDIVTRPATDDDRYKFPHEYAAFKERQAAEEAAKAAAEAADVD